MTNQADPYAGIDFDAINEATALEADEIKCLKTCFDLFDSKKQGTHNQITNNETPIIKSKIVDYK